MYLWNIYLKRNKVFLDEELKICFFIERKINTIIICINSSQKRFNNKILWKIQKLRSSSGVWDCIVHLKEKLCLFWLKLFPYFNIPNSQVLSVRDKILKVNLYPLFLISIFDINDHSKSPFLPVFSGLVQGKLQSW